MNTTPSTTASTSKRTIALVSALAATGVAFAGCSPASTATSVAAAPTVTQTATSTATQTATATSTSTATSTTTTTQQSGAPAPAGGDGKTCVNTNLELTHASDPDATEAGHSGIKLTVKNIGSAACVLPKDTPIELLIQPEGPQQLGAPAAFDPKPSQDLTLAPGATASTSVSIAKTDNYGDKCQPQQAWALALAVGSGTLYVVTPVENIKGCASGDVKLMQAKPFQLN